MIDDYLSLRLAVSEYVGDMNITDNFDRFTGLAENWLNRNLRHRKMLKTATVSMSSGTGTLPTDFIEMLTVVSGTTPLRATTVEDVNALSSHNGRYAINGTSLLIAGATGDQSITYYSKLTALTNPTDTNWLLADSPELYLYAVATEAARFLRAPDVKAFAEADRAQAIRELEAEDFRNQWANSTVTVSGPTP